MKTCVNSDCGARLADDTEVCGNCGMRQPTAESRSAGATERRRNQAVGDTGAERGGIAQGGAGNVQQRAGGDIINNFIYGRRAAGGYLERHLSIYLLLIIGAVLVLLSLTPFSVHDPVGARLQAIGGTVTAMGFINGLLNRRGGLERALLVASGILIFELLLSISGLNLWWPVFLTTISVIVMTIVDLVWSTQTST